MALEMGPVLRLQDRRERTWKLSALVVTTDRDAELRYGERNEGDWIREQPAVLMESRGRYVLRFNLDVELDSSEKRIHYTIAGGPSDWSFLVPGLESNRLRVAFVSCNGFSSIKERRHASAPYERWDNLVRTHERGDRGPFHILLMGGDQVYADPIWDQKSALKRWAQKKGDDKWQRASFSRSMERQANDFYFNLYVESWGRQSGNMREALASIPTVMMWDDHEIFDGWGSYDDAQLDSEVYRGIYAIARKHFQVFQLQRDPGERWTNHICDSDNLSYGFTLGEIGILVLDLRSERRRYKVIDSGSWEAIYKWIDEQSSLNHLLIVSSVPVVNVDLSALEGITGLWDPKDLDDDLRDHWLSRAHKQERLRLIHRLFRFSVANATRVTLLSGDIHVGALGVLEKDRDEELDRRGGSIYQIISSPVVHPTPPAVMRWFYDWRVSGTEEVDQGVTSRFVGLPASNDYYIARRNWVDLEIERSAARRLWCNWHVEDEDTPYTHAIGPRGS